MGFFCVWFSPPPDPVLRHSLNSTGIEPSTWSRRTRVTKNPWSVCGTVDANWGGRCFAYTNTKGSFLTRFRVAAIWGAGTTARVRGAAAVAAVTQSARSNTGLSIVFSCRRKTTKKECVTASSGTVMVHKSRINLVRSVLPYNSSSAISFFSVHLAVDLRPLQRKEIYQQQASWMDDIAKEEL